MSQAARWFTIKNEASAPAAEILIYEQIGKSWWDDSGVGAKDFAEELKAIPQGRQINVHINSVGGNVFEGLAIYHQLQARKQDVVIYVDGLAASIASIIAMAGRETRIPANALIMIHDPASWVDGTAAEMRKRAELLDTVKASLVGIYHAKTRQPVADIEAAMSKETWYTGADAKTFGLVDTVTEEVAIAATFDLSKFRNAPKLPLLGEKAGVRTKQAEKGNGMVLGKIVATFVPVDSEESADDSPRGHDQNDLNMNPAQNTEALSYLDKLKNFFTNSGGTNAGIEVELRATITRQEQEISALKTERTEKDATITDLKAKAEKAAADHTAALEAKEADVEKRAKIKANEVLAKAGHKPISEEDPAKAAGNNVEAQVAELRKQILASKDLKEKSKLSRQIKDLLSPAAKN